MRRGLARLAMPFAVLAVVATGLSAGAMLMEQMVFVPIWRASPPQDFLRWFRENEPVLVAFFAPLQVGSAALAIAAAALWTATRRPRWPLFLVSALLALAVLAVYPLYFQGVNASFVAGTIATGDVAGELARWSAWQWRRIAIGVGAFVSAVLAIRDRAA